MLGADPIGHHVLGLSDPDVFHADGPVERIYYAGQRTRATSGPRSRYAIGFLERGSDGRWHRHEQPVVEGDAERRSAFEPFAVHTDGRWRMWFLSAPGKSVGANSPTTCCVTPSPTTA